MIIERTQIEAKWGSEIVRRKKINKYLGYYDNFQKDDLKDLIESRLQTEESKELKKYLKTDNITKQIINETSLLFQSEVKISIVNGG